MWCSRPSWGGGPPAVRMSGSRSPRSGHEGRGAGECCAEWFKERGGNPHHLRGVEHVNLADAGVEDVGDVDGEIEGRLGKVDPGHAGMQSRVVDPQEWPVCVSAELARRVVGVRRGRREAVLNGCRQLNA